MKNEGGKQGQRMQYEYNFEWGVEGECKEKRTTSEEAMVITNLAYI